jgi:hypothetical protein
VRSQHRAFSIPISHISRPHLWANRSLRNCFSEMESEKTCDHYDHYDYTDDVKDIHWFMLPLKNVSLVLRQRGCVHANDTIAWSSALGVRHATKGVTGRFMVKIINPLD